MNKTQAGRLLTLAHYLRELPPGLYDQDECSIAAEETDPTECGCALHWGAYAKILPSKSDCRNLGPGLLGVTQEEYMSLFWFTDIGQNKPTAKQKARQIEDLVEKYGYTYAD